MVGQSSMVSGTLTGTFEFLPVDFFFFLVNNNYSDPPNPHVCGLSADLCRIRCHLRRSGRLGARFHLWRTSRVDWNHRDRSVTCYVAMVTVSFHLICAGLVLLQPLMALLRPLPSSPNRKYFNWIHFIVGNSAHILACNSHHFWIIWP